LTAAGLAAARRRSTWSLVTSVGLGSIGHIAAVTVGTLAAADISGTSALSGAPAASVVFGAAGGAAFLSALMVRRGRRAGLTLGYLIGVLGALVATVSVVTRSMPLLLIGTFLIGFGNSANNLSRYAAADMYPAARRASAIGTVVWGATVGAVLGPNLIAGAGTLAASIGLPVLAGAYLLPLLFGGSAAAVSFVMLRPDPYELADASVQEAIDSAALAAPLLVTLRRPVVLAAIVALIAGQVVMTLIMTMTPLHMTDNGHGLELVGLILSAHTFGMFALSPISGRLTDRFGSLRVIAVGLATLAVSGVMAALAPMDGGATLFVALFLLGFGWNLGFVAGSALLASGVTLGERTRVQGLTDAMIWTSAALASLSSGLVLALASYTVLGLIGALLVIVPAAMLLFYRQQLAAAT
jgi:MFS family permease